MNKLKILTDEDTQSRIEGDNEILYIKYDGEVSVWLSRHSEVVETYDAIALLIAEGHLFMGNQSGELKMLLICSDIFDWGCTDSEYIDYSEIDNLFVNYYLKDTKWGIIKYICEKRNQQPQYPVVEMMKQDGSWNDDLDRLNRNEYDVLWEEHNIDTKKEPS